jgi:hypothetical protein
LNTELRKGGVEWGPDIFHRSSVLLAGHNVPIRKVTSYHLCEVFDVKNLDWYGLMNSIQVHVLEKNIVHAYSCTCCLYQRSEFYATCAHYSGT